MRSRRERWRRWLVPAGLVGGAALAGYLVTWLVVPATLPGYVVVPPVRGLAQADATELLESVGLRLRLGEDLADPHVESGMISWQSPAAETQLPKGALVMVGVSSGGPTVAVPDLEGLTVELATEILAAGGLRPGALDSADAPGDPGIVIRSVPEAGSGIRSGGVVNLTVSRGASLVAVPALTGLTIREARNQLAAAGLRPGQFSQRMDGKAGTVLAQQPEAGAMVPKGSSVDMTISGARR